VHIKDTDSDDMEERRFALTIFTHESAFFPFEQTIVELLTQFFVGVKAPIQTYILTEDLSRFYNYGSGGNELTLVHGNDYRKVDVEKTKMFAGKSSEVIFMSCHGFDAGTNPSTPAGLSFRCEHNNINKHQSAKQLVWAKDPGGAYDDEDKVTLHEVVQNCRLAIVLGCHGDKLMRDYLSARGQKGIFPAMLICKGIVYGTSMQIFMILLIHIVDSEMNVKGPPAHDAVYRAFLKGIKRIFQIVQLFESDHLGFWTFLETIGCVTKNDVEKHKQQLAYPSNRLGKDPHFRIYGTAFTYDSGYSGSWLLEDFQKLELVTYNGEAFPYRDNYERIPEILISNDTNIDRYLRKWIDDHPPVAVQSLATDHPSIAHKLASLKALSLSAFISTPI
jgi:hypothetical protein